MASANDIELVKQFAKDIGADGLTNDQQRYLYYFALNGGTQEAMKESPFKARHLSHYQHYKEWTSDEKYMECYTIAKTIGRESVNRRAAQNIRAVILGFTDAKLEEVNKNSRWWLERNDDDFSNKNVQRLEGGATTVYLDVKVEGDEPTVDFTPSAN